MKEEIYSVANAMEQYRYASAAVHVFWNYFQVVSVGAAGFVWTRKRTDVITGALAWAIGLLYIAFAIASNYAVYAAQLELVVAASSIKEFSKNSSEVRGELIDLINALKPFDATTVRIWHGALSGTTLIAIMATHPRVLAWMRLLFRR
ncbi:hypothetical protein J2789_007099 [Variovorax paradoxus]|uniref:hypothetical protein n=1 Tax=Variovorax atrisoli TaxID=3394203 RepID=UPI00119C2417|nr:hypothetical protein [Variovorax paradoxus]MDR6524388.1 hypothetical protein [Variovorax paradoxus]